MRTSLALLVSMALGCAWAQQSPGPSSAAQSSRPSPPPSQLEPAVDTSAAAAPAVAPTGEAADAGRAGAAAQQGAPDQPAGGSGSAKSGSPGQREAAAVKAGARQQAKGPDRVELETTDITGNRELPKVLYIVPWKRSDLGDLVGKPPNSLLDEVLEPIDRDVFLRENRYYDALKPDAARPGRGTAQSSGGKP
jgi:hypothetical protein